MIAIGIKVKKVSFRFRNDMIKMTDVEFDAKMAAYDSDVVKAVVKYDYWTVEELFRAREMAEEMILNGEEIVW